MRMRRTIFAVLALISAAALPASAQPGDKIALLIANASYPDADQPLKQPIADARALAAELKRNGFEVEVAENLTKEGMQRAFQTLYGKVKNGTAVILSFGGYGIQTGRQTYLIPVNAQIWTEAEVRRDGTSIDAVLAELNARGATVKVAVLEASRRNPFERRFRGLSAGLAPVTAPRGTLVISAAAPGTVINDSKDENSLFVQELLKEMRSPGLTIEEVFNRTRIGVSRASKGEQVPWISSSLVEDFYLNKSPPAATTPPPVVQRPQPPDVRPERDAEMRRDYEFAERLNTRKGWQDFLAKHKSGSYVNLARDRLASLEPPPPSPSRPQAESTRPQPQAETKPQPSPEPKPPPPQITKAEPQTKPEPSESRDLVMQELDLAIERNPNDGDAYFKRGFALAQKGKFSDAIKDFDQAIRLNPKDAEAFNNRCWARAMIGDLQVALRDCNESLRLKPNFVDALDSRGFVNLKIGLPNSAISDYNAALRISPRHASALYGRGKAKLRNGDTNGGNADIAAAKAINQEIAEEFASYGIK
jgi:tetratricopeptide (TPR) repeat protein